MTAQTKATRPAPDSAAPVQSMRRATGSRDSGSSRRPADERDRGQRHVDDEDRPPPEVLEQDAADHRAERDAEARGRGPDADRHRALARVGEDADQQRERRRHDERGPGAHDGAGDDQPVDAARVGGRRRRGSEHREPGEQRAAAAEAIPERAGQQQQSREHEGVGVDHPLQLAHVGVEVAHQGGERDVDDRVVDDDREQAQAQHAQRQPAPRARRSRRHRRPARRSTRAAGASLADQDHHAEGDQPDAPQDVAEEVRGVDHRQPERREDADEDERRRHAPSTRTSGRRSGGRARR